MADAFPEDMVLAKRLQAREESAAREIFHNWSGQMFGYASRMLHDRAAAEDAVQEALLGALQAIDSYDGRVPLRAWMFGILRHKVLDTLRRRGREAVLPSEDPEQEYFKPNGRWRSDVRFTVWNEDAELLKIVQRCMDELPSLQREVMTLRTLEGLSSREAAQVLDMTDTNLRQTLHRARQSIRRCVAGKTGEAGP